MRRSMTLFLCAGLACTAESPSPAAGPTSASSSDVARKGANAREAGAKSTSPPKPELGTPGLHEELLFQGSDDDFRALLDQHVDCDRRTTEDGRPRWKRVGYDLIEPVYRYDDGTGDKLWVLPSQAGVVLVVFAHESAGSPYSAEPPELAPGLFEGMPEELDTLRKTFFAQEIAENAAESKTRGSRTFPLVSAIRWRAAGAQWNMGKELRTVDAETGQVDDMYNEIVLGKISFDGPSYFERLTFNEWEPIEQELGEAVTPAMLGACWQICAAGPDESEASCPLFAAIRSVRGG